MVDDFLNTIAGLPPAGIYAVVGLLAALENFFPFVPADVSVALGAFMAARGVVNVFGVYLVTIIPNFLAAVAVLELSKRYGKQFLQSRLGRRLVSVRAQRRMARMYERYHLWGIFVTRLLPFYRTVVPPFAAALGLPGSKTLPPIALATASYYGALVAVGYLLGANWEAVKHVVGRIGIGLGVAALLATILGVWLWQRHRQSDEEAPGV